MGKAGSVISIDSSTDKVLIYSGLTATVNDSFASPNTIPLGVTFAQDVGSLVSMGIAGVDKIYIHSGITATIQTSFSPPSVGIDPDEAGLGWKTDTDDLLLLYGDGTTRDVVKYDGASSTILGSIELGPDLSVSTGVMWLPSVGSIFITDSRDDKIYVYSGFTTTMNNSFATPNTNIRGATWDIDSGSMLTSDALQEKIYIHSGATSTVNVSYAYSAADQEHEDLEYLEFSAPPSVRTGSVLSDAYMKGLVTGSLISMDETADKIYIHSGFSTTINDSFAPPATLPKGVTFDVNNRDIISQDRLADKIYFHSGISGTIKSSYDSTSGNLANEGALAYQENGKRLIEGCGSTINKIYVHNGLTSSIVDSFSTPDVTITGLDVINSVGSLLSCDKNSTKIYIHNGISSIIDTSFSSPGASPSGLVYDFVTRDLVSADNAVSKIYLHSNLTATVRSSISSPATDLTGIAFIVVPETFSKTISSDTNIKKIVTTTIDSNTNIKKTQTKTINSDSSVLKIITKTINSDCVILRTESPTIQSDSHIKRTETKTISSDTQIKATQEKTITSDTQILRIESNTITAGTNVVTLVTNTIPSDTEVNINITGSLIACDSATEKIYIFSDVSPTVNDSFASPSLDPRGVAIDTLSGSLISFDPVLAPEKVFVHSGVTSTINSSFTVSTGNLAEEGDVSFETDYKSGSFNMLTCSGSLLNDIEKYVGVTSTVNSSFNSPSTGPSALDYIGFLKGNTIGSLLSGDKSSDKIYVHSSFTATINDSFAAPDLTVSGLVYHEIKEDLVSCGRTNDKVYLHSGLTSVVRQSFAFVGTTPTGMDLLIIPALIKNTIQSNTNILVVVTSSIDSDSSIKVTRTKTIDSNSVIMVTNTKTIDSDIVIKRTETNTINSNAHVKIVNQTSTIQSDTVILRNEEKTVSSDSQIKRTKTFGNQSVLPTQGLITGWHLDEGSGSILDFSGNNNSGSTVNTTWVDGKIGSALSFNGTNSYVDIPHDTSQNITTQEISISAWIKPKAHFSHINIVEKDGASGYKLGMVGSFVEFTIYGAFDNLSTAKLQEDIWYNIVATYDQNNVKIYIDGSLDSTTPHTNAIGSGMTNNMQLGRRSTSWWNGLIDDVAVYNRILGTDEVQEIYDASNRPIKSDSYIKVTNTNTIQSDSHILNLAIENTIQSDTSIKTIGVQSNIFSDATIKRIGESSTIDSLSAIEQTRTIGSTPPLPRDGCLLWWDFNQDNQDVFINYENGSVFSDNVGSWTAGFGSTGTEITGSSDLFGGSSLRISNSDSSYFTVLANTNNLDWTSYKTLSFWIWLDSQDVGSNATFRTGGIVAGGDQQQAYWNMDTTGSGWRYQEIDLENPDGISGSYVYSGSDIEQLRIYMATRKNNDNFIDNFILSTGSTVTDITGSGRTGLLVNTPSQTTGLYGSGLEFAGSGYNNFYSTYVSTLGSVDVGSSITLMGWIYPYTTSNAYILSNKWAGGNDGYQMYVNITSLIFNYGVDSSSHPEYAFDIGISSNQWQHVAVTYNAKSGSINFYKNGSFYGGHIGSGLISNTSNNLWVGRKNNTQGHFDGIIDEASVWNVELSESEIYAIYNEGRGIKSDTIIHRLEEKTIQSNSHIKRLNEASTIQSDSVILRQESSTLQSNTTIKRLAETKTVSSESHINITGQSTNISSDSYIEIFNTKSIQSDTIIKRVETNTITSDTIIKHIDQTNTIDSDINIKRIDEIITISADTYINKPLLSIIQSNTHIKRIDEIITISSNAHISKLSTNTIQSNTHIKRIEEKTISSSSSIADGTAPQSPTLHRIIDEPIIPIIHNANRKG